MDGVSIYLCFSRANDFGIHSSANSSNGRAKIFLLPAELIRCPWILLAPCVAQKKALSPPLGFGSDCLRSDRPSQASRQGLGGSSGIVRVRSIK